MKKDFGKLAFLCLLASCVVLILPAQSQAQEPFSWIWTWNGLPPFPVWDHDCYGYNMAFDSQQNLYVVDSGNCRIIKFDKDGRFVLAWGSYGTENGQFIFGQWTGGGIAIDRDDNVWITEGGPGGSYYRVQKFNNQGGFLAEYVDPNWADYPYAFSIPSGIDIDHDGYFYIVARMPNAQIKKFDPDFSYVNGFGNNSIDDSDPYNFWYSTDVAVNSKGDIYVAVWGEGAIGSPYPSRIKKFNSSYVFQKEWSLDSVTSLAIDADDNLYACSVRGPEMGVYIYNSDGDLIQRIAPNAATPEENGNGLIWSPIGVGVDTMGNVFITDLVGRIQKFAPPFITVSVDIQPVSFPNSVNPKSNGKIPVAILTTDAFDAGVVAPATVTFGKTGSEAAASHYALEDVNGDGRLDMVLHFGTQETGIACGDTKAFLKGKTQSGRALKGEDSIKTVGCK
ncbi:MAG: hypothetical protein JW843_11580 [Candidatus Aminicenantes bacterium]|nr:hypothetical protein [Candidatus Aminicenantes bacterium]